MPFSNSGAVKDLVLQRGGKRAENLLALAALIESTRPIFTWGRSRVVAHQGKFTVTIRGEDEIYTAVHEWVLERLPVNERKALVVKTFRYEPLVRVLYDGSQVQTIAIDQHKIDVSVTKDETSMTSEMSRGALERVSFTATSPAGRDAVIRMVQSLVDQRDKDSRPSLLMPSRWGGGWDSSGDLLTRSLESVVLKQGQLERLVDDVQTFLNNEDRYKKTGQPWHRGYLFHGPPGTGKTSVARALANHFGFPVYYLPLGDIEKDTNLIGLASAVESRSVLLIEDIDVYHAATSRDDEDGASIAATLNILDGVWTPHGLITVLTTNNRDALDDALIRAGRVDVDEEFGLLDLAQVKRLASFMEYSPRNLKDFVGRSPAEFMEVARKNWSKDDTSSKADD